MMENIPGLQSPAGMLTNYVERQLLKKHLKPLALHAETWRAELVPSIDHMANPSSLCPLNTSTVQEGELNA